MGWNPPNNLTTSTVPTQLEFSPPTAYMFPQGTGKGTRHVVFQNQNEHLIEFHADDANKQHPDKWIPHDLTAAAGNAPLAYFAGLPSGYIWSKQPSQHVVYQGLNADKQVHELWWTEGDGWNQHNLTKATNAPLAYVSASPFGFETKYDQVQRVLYVGQDNSTIHELFNHSGRRHHDLIAAEQPLAWEVTAYSFEGEGPSDQRPMANTGHALVSTASRHILEFINDPTGWEPPTDLTTLTGAPLLGAVEGSAAVAMGYVFGHRTQHVIYVDADGRIIELVWDDTVGWLQTPPYNDLTTGLGIITAKPGRPACYAFEAEATQHIFFVGTDSFVHELMWDGQGGFNGWHYNELTSEALGSRPSRYNDVAAFVDEDKGTQNVFYVSDGDVIELQWTP
jgi:hypothetical protein